MTQQTQLESMIKDIQETFCNDVVRLARYYFLSTLSAEELILISEVEQVDTETIIAEMEIDIENTRYQASHSGSHRLQRLAKKQLEAKQNLLQKFSKFTDND